MTSSLSLEKTIYTMDQLTEMLLPQLALVGRSNVGKSSLLNKLAGRKHLAKTSSTPGKTRSLNFYKVNPDAFYLVDLPGYGYARCSKTERNKWAVLINKYLHNNNYLFAVVALFDARLPPQNLDIELVIYMQEQGVEIVPIMTKADKCKQALRQSNQRLWQEILQTSKPPLLTSSHTGMNMDKLWQLCRDKHADFLQHNPNLGPLLDQDQNQE
jgi:GTP-binding protein